MIERDTKVEIVLQTYSSELNIVNTTIIKISPYNKKALYVIILQGFHLWELKDSDLPLSAWEAGTLPTELHSHKDKFITTEKLSQVFLYNTFFTEKMKKKTNKINQMIELIILFSILIIRYFLWNTNFVYPIKLFVVMFHELGHTLAAILNGV